MSHLFKTLLRALVDLCYELDSTVYGYCHVCFDHFRKNDPIQAEKKRLKETIKDLEQYHSLLIELNRIYLSSDSDDESDFAYEIHKLNQLEKDFGTTNQIGWTIQHLKKELKYWSDLNLNVNVNVNLNDTVSINNAKTTIQQCDLSLKNNNKFIEKLSTVSSSNTISTLRLKMHQMKNTDKELLLWIAEYNTYEIERFNFLIDEVQIPTSNIFWYYASHKPLDDGKTYYLNILRDIQINTDDFDRLYRKIETNRLQLLAKELAAELAAEEAGLPECPICSFRKDMPKTICNHQICPECLHKWLDKSANCPICRTILVQP